jgi:ParB-like chromosome segregation protein Spo0J
MKTHEYADLFPMMATADIARLAEDIRENGQADAIITYEGKILDGRNRYQACLMVDVDPIFSEYEGTDPLTFVVSHNLHRRHLNESQRGMVGAKLANMQQGGDRKSDEIKSAIAPLITQKQAAAMLNIGVDSIKRSKTVLKSGIPELQDMQMSGDISAKAASVVAKLPQEQQRKAVCGGITGVKNAAKEAKAVKELADTIVADESKTENEPLPKWIPDDADRLWRLAHSDLEKILSIDKSRERVMREIIEYAQKRINTKK